MQQLEIKQNPEPLQPPTSLNVGDQVYQYFNYTDGSLHRHDRTIMKVNKEEYIAKYTAKFQVAWDKKDGDEDEALM